MKQEMERNINTLLSDWERICRSEAVSMIHSAQVLASSEHVRNYVSGELEKGADFQLLLQKINALWDAFGQSLALEPVEFFESILIDSPTETICVCSRVIPAADLSSCTKSGSGISESGQQDRGGELRIHRVEDERRQLERTEQKP